MKIRGLFQRSMAMVLSAYMLLSCMGDALGAFSLFELLGGDRIQTYAATKDVVVRTADKGTTDEYKDFLLDEDSTRYAGRVWTDKSAFANGQTVEVDGIKEAAFDEDFLEVFSALGSSMTVTGQQQIPLDVMFVLDLSGSMGFESDDMTFGPTEYYTPGLRVKVKPQSDGWKGTYYPSRLEGAVNALEAAFSYLMQNPDNRAGLYIYSGPDTSGGNGTRILKLEHHTPRKSQTDNTKLRYFDYMQDNGWGRTRPSWQYMGVPTQYDGYCYVYNNSRIGITTDPSRDYWGNPDTYTAGGATNTQMGMYEAMNYMAGVDAPDGEKLSDRQPVVILITDGQPTSSFSGDWWNPKSGSYQGPGNGSHIANGMLVMATSAYEKQLINKHYADASGNNKYPTKIVTIGVDVNAMSTTDMQFAQTTLNPKEYFANTANNAMAKQMLDKFNEYIGNEKTAGKNITVSHGSGNYTMKHPTGSDSWDIKSLDDLYYNDFYREASGSSLSDILQEIVSGFGGTVDVPISGAGELDEADMLSYSDPIGEYMEVKSIYKLRLLDQEYKIKDNKDGTYSVDVPNGQNIVTNTSYGEDSEYTFDLNKIVIRVDSETVDGLERQTLRVDIPAMALPVRTAKVDLDENGNVIGYTTNIKTEDGEENPDALPLRLFYTVGVDEDYLDKKTGSVDLNKISLEYKETHRDPNTGRVSFYSNFYSGSEYSYTTNTEVSDRGDSFTTFSPAETNPYYLYQENLTVYDAKTGKPVTDYADMSPTGDYYFNYPYYTPTGKTTVQIDRKGAMFGSGIPGESDTGEYLVYYNTESGQVIEDLTSKPAGSNWVIATKVGGVRVGNMGDHQDDGEKGTGNNTHTSGTYYLPTLSEKSGKDGVDSILTNYLGNNGMLSVNDVSLFVTKAVDSDNPDPDESFKFSVTFDPDHKPDSPLTAIKYRLIEGDRWQRLATVTARTSADGYLLYPDGTKSDVLATATNVVESEDGNTGTLEGTDIVVYTVTVGDDGAIWYHYNYAVSLKLETVQLTVGADGRVEFELKHGEGLVFTGLTEGSFVTVDETLTKGQIDKHYDYKDITTNVGTDTQGNEVTLPNPKGEAGENDSRVYEFSGTIYSGKGEAALDPVDSYVIRNEIHYKNEFVTDFYVDKTVEGADGIDLTAVDFSYTVDFVVPVQVKVGMNGSTPAQDSDGYLLDEKGAQIRGEDGQPIKAKDAQIEDGVVTGWVSIDPANEDITYVIYHYDGADPETTEGAVDAIPFGFTLKDSERIEFCGIPVGARYLVKETPAGGYIVKQVVATDDGVVNAPANGAAAGGALAKLTDTAIPNYAKYTNYKLDIPSKSEVTPGEDQLVSVGQEITYTITWGNFGEDAAQVKITDQLDPGVDFTKAAIQDFRLGDYKVDISKINSKDGIGTGTITVKGAGEEGADLEIGFEITYDDHTVVWLLDSAPVGAEGSVSLTVTVNENASAGWTYDDTDAANPDAPDYEVQNRAGVDVGNTGTPEYTNIVKNPVTDKTETGATGITGDFEIEVKDDGTVTGPEVSEGGVITYRINYGNSKDEKVRVVVKDQLDPGLDFESASYTILYDDGTRDAEPITLTQEMALAGTPAIGGGKTMYGDPAVEVDVVTISYDAKTHTVTWTLYDRPADSADYVVMQASVNDKAKYGERNGAVNENVEDDQVVNKATVTVGGSTLVTNDVVNPVPGNTTVSIAKTETVYQTVGTEEDGSLIYDTAGKTAPAQGEDEALLTVKPYDKVTYTLTVKNIGDEVAKDVIVTDAIPVYGTIVMDKADENGENPQAMYAMTAVDAATNQPITGAQFDITADGKTLVWSLGDLAIGQEVILTFTVIVPEVSNAAEWINVALASAENDPNNDPNVPKDPEDGPHKGRRPRRSNDVEVETGVLVVTKKAYGVGTGDTTEFGFSVDLIAEGGVELPDYVTVTLREKDGTTTETIVSVPDSGELSFTLHDRESVTIKGLPQNMGYVVTELTPDTGYKTTVTGSGTNNNAAKTSTGKVPEAGYANAEYNNYKGQEQVKRETQAGETKVETGSTSMPVVQVGDDVLYEIDWANNATKTADITIEDKLDNGVDFKQASYVINGETVTLTKAMADAGTAAASTINMVEVDGKQVPAVTIELTADKEVVWTIRNVAAAGTGTVKLTVTVNENALKSWTPEGGSGDGLDNKIINQASVMNSVDKTPEPTDKIENETSFGGVIVTKTVKVNGAVPEEGATELNTVFNFTITFTYTNDAGKQVPYVGDITVQKTGEDAKTVTLAAADEGKYIFSLKHGESIKITDVPEGVTYVIHEAENTDYVETADVKDTIKANKDDEVEVEFVNNKKEDNGKKVDKTKTGVGEVLTYTITWSNNTSNTAEVTVTDELMKGLEFIPASAEPAVSSVVKDAETGKTKLVWELGPKDSLASGEVVFKVLVTEDAFEYDEIANRASIKCGDNPAYEVGPAETMPLYGELAVSKTVNGLGGDKNKDFTFKVKLYYAEQSDGGRAEVLLTGSYDYERTNGTPASGTLTPGEDGWYVFTLKHNETVTIKDLPANTQYEVVEVEANKDGYETTSRGAKGTIASGNTSSAIFENSKEDDRDQQKEEVTPGADKPVQEGDFVVYEITWTNNKLKTAEVVITDKLDPGVDFVQAKFGAADETENETWYTQDSPIPNISYENGTVTWKIPQAAAESSGKVTLVVRVNENAKEAGRIANEATVSIDNKPEQTNKVENPVPEPKKEEVTPGANKPAPVGEIIEYTISWQNYKNTAATVTITDKLDPGVEFVSADNGGSYNAETHTVTWVLTNRAAGSDGKVTLKVRVTADALADENDDVENSASVAVGDDPAVETDTVWNPVPDPKKEEVTPGDGKRVLVGDTIEYTISWRNYRNEAATVTITDRLDPGVTYVSSSDNGVYDSSTHTVTWNLGTKAAGDSGKVTLDVVVNENAEFTWNYDEPTLDDSVNDQKVYNQGGVTVGDDPEIKTNIVENRIPPYKTEVTPGEDVAVQVGDEITYSIYWKNYDTEPATVKITDYLDDGVDHVSADNDGLYDEADHKVTWDLGEQAGGAEGYVQVTVRVNERAQRGWAYGDTDTGGATGTDDNEVVNKASVEVGNTDIEYTNTVRNPIGGGLTVSKTVTGTAGNTNQSFGFKVTLDDKSINGKFGEMVFKDGVAEFSLKHNESKTAKGLPAGTGYTVEESNNDGYTVSSSGATGTIPANNTVTAGFVNNRDEEVFDPAIRISKTQSLNGGEETTDLLQVVEGDIVTYYLKVESIGSTKATEIVVTDEIPDGLKLIEDEDAISDGGALASDGKTIVWNLPDLEPTETYTVSFKVLVPSVNVTTRWKNTANASYDDPNDPPEDDPDPDDPHRGRKPKPSNDVEIEESAKVPNTRIEKSQALNGGEKTTELLVVAAGDSVTYYLTVYSDGPGIAKDVVVTDEIPTGLILASIQNDGVIASDGKTIVWSLGDMDAGTDITVSFTVTVPAVTETTRWLNTAQVSNDDPNDPPADDPDPDDPHKGRKPKPSNDVEIEEPVKDPMVSVAKEQSVNGGTKTTAQQTVKPGDKVTYYLTVTSSGKDTAKDVVLTDVIPNGLILVKGSITNGGVLSSDGKTIVWYLGDMEPGTSITVSFTVTVPNGARTMSWKNVAQVSCEDPDDPTPENPDPNDPHKGRRPKPSNEVVIVERTVPKTGDDRNTALWLTLLVASGAALGVTAVKGKTRKERRAK